MRRLGVLILSFFIVLAFFATRDRKNEDNIPFFVENSSVIKNKDDDHYVYNSRNKVDYTVLNIIKKKSSVEYILSNDTIAVEFTGESSRKFNRIIKDKINVGDRVCVKGKEKKLDNFYLDNFNYGRYLKSRGIKKYFTVENMRKTGSNRFYHFIGSIKKSISDTNKFLFKKNSDILNSLILGEKLVDSELESIFTDSGTRHIMAISGLHIAIISSIAVCIIGSINRVDRLILFAFIMKLYVIMVGEGYSVERAYIVVIIQALCSLFKKRFDLLNALCYIASYSIAENPYIIYNVTFQMSYLSMASIGIYTKYIKEYIKSDILASTISSSILMTPILALYFEQVTPVSILGNIVIIPFLTLIVLLDLVSVSLYSFVGFLYQIPVFIEKTILDTLLNLLKFIGNFGVNTIEFKKFDISFVVLYYIIVIVFSMYFYRYTLLKSRIEKERYDFILGEDREGLEEL